MSIGFSNPRWLYLPFLVALIGLALLWQRRRRESLFPTLEFFSPETPGGASAPQAGIDWLWVLMLSGALLAASAPASPHIQFRFPFMKRSISAPPWQVHAVARSFPGAAVAELFVRSNAAPHKCHWPLTLRGVRRVMTFSISSDQIRGGVTLPGIPATRSLHLTLAESPRALWSATLRRTPAAPRASVNLIGRPPEALLRLMKLIPGVGGSCLNCKAAIWLVESSRFQPEAIPPSRRTVVLAIGRTVAPAMQVGGIVRPSRSAKVLSTAASDPVLRHVSFATVRVARMFAAHLGGGWRILARMDGLPWLARRVSPRTHIQWFWLASPPRGVFTDWQQHASFVIFFVNVLRRVTGPSRNMEAGGWWRPAAPSASARRAPAPILAARSYPLSMGLALLAALLLMLAAIGFVHRYPRMEIET